ncbi:uncharacterized protein METZ01_LOCUS89782, partial [marine metagenome]
LQAFQACAIDHSAISPEDTCYINCVT